MGFFFLRSSSEVSRRAPAAEVRREKGREGDEFQLPANSLSEEIRWEKGKERVHQGGRKGMGPRGAKGDGEVDRCRSPPLPPRESIRPDRWVHSSVSERAIIRNAGRVKAGRASFRPRPVRPRRCSVPPRFSGSLTHHEIPIRHASPPRHVVAAASFVRPAWPDRIGPEI